MSTRIGWWLAFVGLMTLAIGEANTILLGAEWSWRFFSLGAVLYLGGCVVYAADSVSEAIERAKR